MSKEQIKITNRLNIKFSDLMRPVDLSCPFTLNDVLRAAVKSTQIPVEVMSAILRCRNLGAFWKDACRKPYREAEAFKNDGGIEWLELSWSGTKSTYDGELYQESGWDFSGVGKKGVIPKDLIENKIKIDDPENYRTSFAVELTPLSNLKGLPVRISGEMVVTDHDKLDEMLKGKRAQKRRGKWPKREKDPSLTIVKFRPMITLVELLYEILWELSFFGSPEDRDDKKEELHKRIDDFKTAKANGTLKTISFNSVEEMKEHLKKAGAIADMKKKIRKLSRQASKERKAQEKLIEEEAKKG